MKRAFWVAYDAINSILIIIGAVYFTKWLIADAGVPDAIVALATSLATLLFVVIGPRFGAALDSEKRAFGRLLTLTVIVCGLGFFLGIPGLQSKPTTTVLVAVVFAFFLLNLMYQLSLVAYNCYLTALVPRQKIQRFSGIGESAGQFGSLLGLAIAIAILSSDPGGWFSASPVRLFLVVGPAVFVLSIACVLGMRTPDSQLIHTAHVTSNARILSQLFGKDSRKSHFTTLIVVIFLYNNAFATLQIFASSYLAIVAHWEETQIGLGILLTFIGAGTGGILGALTRPRIGIQTKLLIGTIEFTLSIVALSLASTDWQFRAALLIAGLGFGYLAAVSRACVVLFRNSAPIGVRFGLYGAASRTAAIVGPLLWAGLLAFSSPLGEELSRRIALVGLSALALAACILLVRTKDLMQFDNVDLHNPVSN